MLLRMRYSCCCQDCASHELPSAIHTLWCRGDLIRDLELPVFLVQLICIYICGHAYGWGPHRLAVPHVSTLPFTSWAFSYLALL